MAYPIVRLERMGNGWIYSIESKDGKGEYVWNDNEPLELMLYIPGGRDVTHAKLVLTPIREQE